MTTQQDFGLEDLFGSISIGAGTEATNMAAQLSIFRGEVVERKAESGKPEKALTIGEAVEQYLASTGASQSTRVEYTTTLRKYSEWLAEPSALARLHRMESAEDESIEADETANPLRCMRPVSIRELSRESLREFIDWVFQRAVAEGAGNPGCTANKTRGNLSSVLNWACDQEFIDAVPKLPKKREQRDQAGLHFLEEDELNRLYWGTYKLKLRGWRNKRATLGAYWRAALVFFYNYGVDTGTVFSYLARHEPLLWRHVSFDPLCPDRSQRIESEFGWIYYVRTKTGKKFMRPMNRVVALHLRSLVPHGIPAELLDEPVFDGGSNRPADMFHNKLCKIAALPPKVDFETGNTSQWTFKDLRKTSATWHDQHCAGAGSAILGHALPGSAAVTSKHYSNTNPLATRSLLTLPQPAAFRSIYDESIVPPGQLFAK